MLQRTVIGREWERISVLDES